MLLWPLVFKLELINREPIFCVDIHYLQTIERFHFVPQETFRWAGGLKSLKNNENMKSSHWNTLSNNVCNVKLNKGGLRRTYASIFWIYRQFYVVVVSEESITRLDRYQLTWLSFDVSQGSAPLKSTQEILSARDPVSGGHSIPTDFISSKWKPWDLLQRTIQHCKQTAQYVHLSQFILRSST